MSEWLLKAVSKKHSLKEPLKHLISHGCSRRVLQQAEEKNCILN
jgi:hypothetical protein